MIHSYYKLIYFLPFALITGPFLTNLIVLICSILFLIDTFRLKLFEYYNNNFFKIFLVFCIILNLSAFFSDNLNTFKYSISYLRYGIFSIFLFYVLRNKYNSQLLLGYSVIFTCILLLFDGYFQFIFDKNIFSFEIQKYNEQSYYITSFFRDEKILGSFLTKIFPIFLLSLMLVNNKFNYFKFDKIFSILILLYFFMIILTTERVAIFYIIIFILILFFKSQIFFKPKLFFFIFITIALISFFYLNPNFFYKIKSIFYSTGLIHPGYSNDGKILGEYDFGKFIYSKFHQEQIFFGINTFIENPFFGIGAKNFKNIFDSGWHPHNYHAQVLSEIGIFGYFIFISTYIFLIIKLLINFFRYSNKDSKNEINLYLLTGFVIILTPIPSGDFFNGWVNTLIFFPVGFYLDINEK